MKELSLGLAVTLTTLTNALPAQAQAQPASSDQPDTHRAQAKSEQTVTPAQGEAIAQQTQPTTETATKVEFSAPAPLAPTAQPSMPSASTPILAELPATSERLLPAQIRQRLGTSATPLSKSVLPVSTPSAAPPVAMSQAEDRSVQSETVPSAEAAQVSSTETPSDTAVKIAVPAPATPTSSPAPQFGAPIAQESSAESDLAEKLRLLEERQQKLEQELQLLRQQAADSSKASQPTAISVPETEPQGLHLFSDALFFRPHTSNSLDFAIIDPGTALATSGDLATAKYNNATAFRVGLNYRLPKSPWDVEGSYTFFDTSGAATATRPDTGFLFSTLSHPRQNESADTASARSTLDFNTVNLDAGYRFNLSRGLGIRLFGGLQIADTQQSLVVDYNGRDYNNGQVALNSKFNGWGPRVGAELRASLGSGFSLFGRGSAALLFGQSSARFTETDNNGADVIANVPRKSNRTVPVVNLALGLDWQAALSQNSKFNLSVGYEFQHWFDVTDNVRFVNGPSPAVFAENAGSLSLQGFFVRGGLSFNF